MAAPDSCRLLSIGEFAAATQLSPKALRIYDEQGILRPATVDAANGYRYYHADQIPTGRLIRALRDMDLPLAEVAQVAQASAAQAEALLRQFAHDSDRRFARQKQALQSALTLLRPAAPTEGIVICERARAAATVAVRPFLADRRSLLERFRAEVAAAKAALAMAGLQAVRPAACVLIDPPTDDEGRCETAIPIDEPDMLPSNVTLRRLPAAPCAQLTIEEVDPRAIDLAAALDAMFDWLDRRGVRAAEPPTLSVAAAGEGVSAEIIWAFER